MIRSNRVRIVLALTTLAVLALSTPGYSQKVNHGGSNKNDNKRDTDNGGRRNRNRNNDNQNNGIQLGGSDVQQIQQAIQGVQGNPDNGQQLGQPGSVGNQFQGGKKSKKSQQWQNWQQNGQGNFKKKHKHNDWQGWAIQFGGPAPFSAQWYNHHPHAWNHHHLDDDDAWKIASAAGVLGWLGWHADPYHHDHHHTVIYEPVPYETIYVRPAGL